MSSPAAPAVSSGDQKTPDNPIRTLVFFDTETTGLPAYEFNRTRIVELALVACSVEHIRSMRQATPQEHPPPVPRVLHKLTVCLNPLRPITGGATLTHILDNALLEHEQPFDAAAGRLMVEFLNRLQKPVCLVAYNGDRFDYPLLRKQLLDIGADLGADLRCVDAMLMFQRIDELHDAQITVVDDDDESRDSLAQVLKRDASVDWRRLNETTPRQNRKLSQRPKTEAATKEPAAKRKLSDAFGTSANGSAAKRRYKSEDVYKRLFDALPEQAHHAEGDAMAMLRCVCKAREQFLALLDDESKPFADVDPLGK